jgi:hypothetical protein
VPAQTTRTPRPTSSAAPRPSGADDYNDVVARARELNIPILNQNRFLYYIGHFEQAQR